MNKVALGFGLFLLVILAACGGGSMSTSTNSNTEQRERDFDAGNGVSACNPDQTFVTDQRGSSVFFAAWRPYVFFAR